MLRSADHCYDNRTGNHRRGEYRRTSGRQALRDKKHDQGEQSRAKNPAELVKKIMDPIAEPNPIEPVTTRPVRLHDYTEGQPQAGQDAGEDQLHRAKPGKE
jgi:hypothetical protein